MTDPAKLYFSLQGTVGRSDWWLGLFPLAVLAVLLPDSACYVITQFDDGRLPTGTRYNLALLLTALVVLHPIIAIFVKRLRDINRSEWWAGYLLLPFMLLPLLHAFGLPSFNLLTYPVTRAVIHLHLAISFWLLAEMGFRKSPTEVA